MWPNSEQTKKCDQTQNKQRNVTKLRINKKMWPNAEQTKKCDQTQNKELWPNAGQRNVNKQENNQIKKSQLKKVLILAAFYLNTSAD